MTHVVGERFQITIGKRVREQLGIKPGDQAIERVEDGRLVVEFSPKSHRESLLGIFRAPGISPIGDWRAVKERAWEARAAEIADVLGRDTRHHGEAAGRGGE